MLVAHPCGVKHEADVCGVEGVIDKGALADKAAEPQIGADQRRGAGHGGAAVKLIGGDDVHRHGMGRQGAHLQLGRGKVVMGEIGQGLCQCRHIGAVERGGAEQNLDIAFQHIGGQRAPQLQHGAAAAIGRMHARPPQFHQLAPSGFQCAEVIFAFGIEAAGADHPVRGQKPISPHHIIEMRRVAAGIDQQKVVEMRIEGVDLEQPVMVDQGAICAQFLHEDSIAQPLRGAQIAVVTGKPQDKGAVVVRHSCFFPAPIGFGSRTGLRAMQLRLPVRVAGATNAIQGCIKVFLTQYWLKGRKRGPDRSGSGQSPVFRRVRSSR